MNADFINNVLSNLENLAAFIKCNEPEEIIAIASVQIYTGRTESTGN